MSGTTRSSPRWNLFARELEDILAVRGLRLGHLDDRAGIRREKVRRLQQSLIDPKFNLLSPDDLEDIRGTFALNEDEMSRLRAAMLATAVEELLMDRIDRDDALIAAEQLLPIVQRALRAHAGDSFGMGMVKGEEAARPAGGERPTTLEECLVEYDRGMVAWQLGLMARRRPREPAHAAYARDCFARAIVLLEAPAVSEQEREARDVWMAEARKAWAASSQRLRQLAESAEGSAS